MPHLVWLCVCVCVRACASLQGDQQKSQEWKHILEEQQRKDRKLRKDFGGVHEH